MKTSSEKEKKLNLALSKLKNLDLTIYGNGQQKRNYIYAEDLGYGSLFALEKKATKGFNFEEEATQALRLILAYLGQLLIDNSNKTYETESVLLHSNINDCTIYQRIARQFLYIEGLQRCVHEKFKHNPFPMHNEIKDLIPEHILQWAKVNDPKLFGAATRAWDRKDSGNSNA